MMSFQISTPPATWILSDDEVDTTTNKVIAIIMIQTLHCVIYISSYNLRKVARFDERPKPLKSPMPSQSYYGVVYKVGILLINIYSDLISTKTRRIWNILSFQQQYRALLQCRWFTFSFRAYSHSIRTAFVQWFLKVELLHNGNTYPSVPLAHSVHMKET